MASFNVTDERNNFPSDELTNQQTEILEYGDIYFFYRPKVRSEQVKSIDDVRRSNRRPFFIANCN
jgi:hypothetical protein